MLFITHLSVFRKPPGSIPLGMSASCIQRALPECGCHPPRTEKEKLECQHSPLSASFRCQHSVSCSWEHRHTPFPLLYFYIFSVLQTVLSIRWSKYPHLKLLPVAAKRKATSSIKIERSPKLAVFQQDIKAPYRSIFQILCGHT